MIELNLLPKELQKRRKKRKAAQMPKLPLVQISVGIIVVLFFTHIVLMILVSSNRKLSDTLKKKWTEMQPQREKTDGIAQEINKLDKRVSAVRKITKPDLDWARLLGGLNQAVISNIWLSEFKITSAGGDRERGDSSAPPISLDLTGYALGKSEIAMSTVGRFMDSLKGNKDFYGYFKEIELQNIRNATLSGEEVMMFKLICSFKKTEPAKTEPEKKTSRTSRTRRRR